MPFLSSPFKHRDNKRSPRSCVKPAFFGEDTDHTLTLDQQYNAKYVFKPKDQEHITVNNSTRSSFCISNNTEPLNLVNVECGHDNLRHRCSAYLRTMFDNLHLYSNNDQKIRQELNRHGLHNLHTAHFLYDSSEVTFNGVENDKRIHIANDLTNDRPFIQSPVDNKYLEMENKAQPVVSINERNSSSKSVRVHINWLIVWSFNWCVW